MRILKIISQYRRDFEAEYVCEHCNHTVKSRGYDDSNFHNNVIPMMPCEKCGLTASDDYRPLQPKYPDFQVV